MASDVTVQINKNSVIRDSIYGKRVRPTDVLLTGVIYGCAGLSILIPTSIMRYVSVRGIPHVTWAFLSTASSTTEGTFGILENIVDTLYIMDITLLVATPIGISSAMHLNEYTRPGKTVRAVEFTTKVLSSVPSTIFGLFGMVFFGSTLGLRYSILTGALTLTLMILPLITRATQEALKAAPDGYRHGALGIETTKWYMIRTIFPLSAIPGILMGVILAIGRIVGESAALLLTTGSGYYLPKNLLHKVLESGRTLTIQLYLFMQEAKYDEAFAVAVVLLVIVPEISGLAKYLSHGFNVEK